MATEQEKAEWENPENWHGALLGIYVAPRDPRIWVPKRNPFMGWTLNFAHRAAWWWMAALVGLPLAVVLIVVWVASRAA